MHTVSWLVEFVGPSEAEKSENEEASPAKKLLATCMATLLALAAASLWGVIVGAGGHLSLSNVLTVPMLLVGSAVAALPLAVFVLKLTTQRMRARDLLLAYSTGAFAGCTTLLLLAPLVAIYQQSSALVGTWVGPLSAFLAFGVGGLVGFRALWKLRNGAFGSLVAPVAILVLVQAATLLQLASLANPLYGKRTPLGYGIDGASSQPVGARPQ